MIRYASSKSSHRLSSDEVGNKTRPDNNYDPENQNPNHSDANLNLETQPNRTCQPEPDASLDTPYNQSIHPNNNTDFHDNQFIVYKHIILETT